MRILTVGECTLDHFGVVERFLEPDFEVEMSKFSVQGGGCAATAAVTASRWGAETRFAGKTGSDARGDLIEMTLADEGVDTSALIHEGGAVSQFRFILVEAGTGRKKTVFTRGSVSPLDSAEVDSGLLDGVDVVLVDGAQRAAQLELIGAARERDIRVVFVANSRQRDAQALVDGADYLVASERFASEFAGVGRLEKLCETLLERGLKGVAVTMGDEGVVGMCSTDGALIRQEAYPVDVVDSTGAGDVFAGAFTYGLLHDWDFERVISVANRAGAMSCTDIGSRSAIPSLADVEAAGA
ncbi:MAG: carbohydrate kinase family protein [Persicimonas sp.]